MAKSTTEGSAPDDLFRVFPGSESDDNADNDGASKPGEGEGDSGAKKWAGRYDTPEDLEKGYRESSSEAIKLKKENDLLKQQLNSRKSEGANLTDSSTQVGDGDQKVSMDKLRQAYEKDPLATTIWIQQNVGREQAVEVFQDLTNKQKAADNVAETRTTLGNQYPDLRNKESELFKTAALEFEALNKREPGMSEAGKLQLAVERAASKLGVNPQQRDEAQRQFDVSNNSLETSQGRKSSGSKTVLTEDEKIIASKLGLSEDDYLKGLEGQGGRRVRVTAA